MSGCCIEECKRDRRNRTFRVVGFWLEPSENLRRARAWQKELRELALTSHSRLFRILFPLSLGLTLLVDPGGAHGARIYRTLSALALLTFIDLWKMLVRYTHTHTHTRVFTIMCVMC